mmetsp:Transcript_42095/g.132514  ORF Transcript_42095/g.132514 Transcript_42095/m.132514 type:complete len:652 (+) Transcript_42095:102-2057(+)
MERDLSRSERAGCPAKPCCALPASVIFAATGLAEWARRGLGAPGPRPRSVTFSGRQRRRSGVALSPVILPETGASRRGGVRERRRSPVTLALGPGDSARVTKGTCRGPVTLPVTSAGRGGEPTRSLTLPQTGWLRRGRTTASAPWSSLPAWRPSLCVLMRTPSRRATWLTEVTSVTRGVCCDRRGVVERLAHRGTNPLAEWLRGRARPGTSAGRLPPWPTVGTWAGRRECKAPDHAWASPPLGRCRVTLRPAQFRTKPPRTISMPRTSRREMRPRGRCPPTALAAESQESRRSLKSRLHRMTVRPASWKPSSPPCTGESLSAVSHPSSWFSVTSASSSGEAVQGLSVGRSSSATFRLGERPGLLAGLSGWQVQGPSLGTHAPDFSQALRSAPRRSAVSSPRETSCRPPAPSCPRRRSSSAGAQGASPRKPARLGLRRKSSRTSARCSRPPPPGPPPPPGTARPPARAPTCCVRAAAEAAVEAMEAMEADGSSSSSEDHGTSSSESARVCASGARCCPPHSRLKASIHSSKQISCGLWRVSFTPPRTSMMKLLPFTSTSSISELMILCPRLMPKHSIRFSYTATIHLSEVPSRSSTAKAPLRRTLGLRALRSTTCLRAFAPRCSAWILVAASSSRCSCSASSCTPSQAIKSG